MDLKDFVDDINDGKDITYLGEKTPFWSSSLGSYDVYQFYNEIDETTSNLYVDLDDSSVDYVTFENTYVGKFTVSPTAETFSTSHFEISGCSSSSE